MGSTRTLSSLLALLGFLAAATPVPAHAQTASRVLLAGTCLPPGVTSDSVLRMLRAELAPARVEALSDPGDVTPGDVVLGLSDCTESPPAVRIVLWHDRERRERTVSLSDVAPEDWTRLLAIALAETRVDPTVSRAAPFTPVPWMSPPPVLELPDAPEPVKPSAVRTAPSSSEGLGLRTYLAARFAPRTSTPGAGAGTAVLWQRIGVGAALFGARTELTPGDVTLWMPVATGFYELLEFDAHLRLRTSLELGAAIASGNPREGATGRTGSGFHAALHCGLAGAWPIVRGTELELAGHVGYASSLRPRADGEDVVSMDGLLFTVEAGLRF